MPRFNWRSLWIRLSPGTPRAPARARHSTRLAVEELEDRAVPSATPLDLTIPGAAGSINGALFQQFSPQATGSGNFQSFVRIQTHGNNSLVEQGYNTDARPLQFDEGSTATFTRALPLELVPGASIGGGKYREFVLDINQKSSQPLLSLDQLRIYTADVGNLSGYDPTTQKLAGHTAVFDLGDNWVKLNAGLSSGSGSGDMRLQVPESVFSGAAYVYLYSSFGLRYGANAGFEEWDVGSKHAVPAAPATASISGNVTEAGLALQGITLSLWSGQTLVATTTTDANGFYSFTGLAAGTYTVTETPPLGDIGQGAAGTIVGGSGAPDGTNQGASITNIVLNLGDIGINYDFSNFNPGF